MKMLASVKVFAVLVVLLSSNAFAAPAWDARCAPNHNGLPKNAAAAMTQSGAMIFVKVLVGYWSADLLCSMQGGNCVGFIMGGSTPLRPGQASLHKDQNGRVDGFSVQNFSFSCQWQ